MEPMSDSAMSAVRGRDGVSFDLNGFAMSGDARVSYTTPVGSSLYVEKFHASRSDNPLPFSDPYRLDILPSAPGLADYINIAFPVNTNGEQRWQMAYDWGVGADGVVREQGSVVVKDLVLYGGGLQFTTPQVNDGIAFGAALKLDIGQLSFQPRGRDDATEAMASGRIMAAAWPWVLAHGRAAGGDQCAQRRERAAPAHRHRLAGCALWQRAGVGRQHRGRQYFVCESRTADGGSRLVADWIGADPVP
jgi:hypothetical protein